MGQIDAALICYQKSAILVEKSRHVVNQGFIRQWIGELLVSRQQFGLAALFFRAAYLKWEHASPPRASRAMQLAARGENRFGMATQYLCCQGMN
jgi:hypothetical protein